MSQDPLPTVDEPQVIHSGFGPLVATPGLYFCTVQQRSLLWPFGVYMRHGSPGGEFWRNDAPLQSFGTRDAANAFIDRLAGCTDAHKAFLDEFFYR